MRQKTPEVSRVRIQSSSFEYREQLFPSHLARSAIHSGRDLQFLTTCERHLQVTGLLLTPNIVIQTELDLFLAALSASAGRFVQSY